MDLKPCPFCGATTENGLTVGYKGQPATSYHVACTRCGNTGPDSGYMNGPGVACDKWNTRQPDVEREDSKRLDWLTLHGASTYRSLEGRHWVVVNEAAKTRKGNLGDTLRDAIDDARRDGGVK